MENILLFLTMMIPITWSPGPNNIMCATIGMKKGILSSIPFIIGINTPILFYSLLTGFGLNIIIEQVPFLIDILKQIGGIYILYLALKVFSSNNNSNKMIKFGFKDGFIISVMNAKIITALVLMYSQFINTDVNNVQLVLILSISFVLLCMFGHFMWVMIGKFASVIFKTKKSIQIQNVFFSFMLFIVGIWILFI